MLSVLLVLPSGSYAQETGERATLGPRPQAEGAPAHDVISKALAREISRLRVSGVTLVPQSQQGGQQRSWPARHPVWTGFLIGAGAGAVLGAAAGGDCVDYGDGGCPALKAALGGGLLGGIGALIGLAF